MKLRGQSESGWAMAVLLVSMSIMAILLTAAMPVWKQMSQREKEQELIFRGQQYVRAIGLFERKYANTPPPTLDVLVQEKFLRKKYKDPITNQDFVPVPAAGAVAINSGGATQSRATPGPGQGIVTVNPAGRGGGVIGVTSSSKAPSIRIFNGATHYNEWMFVYAAPAAAPGLPGGGASGVGPGLGPGVGGRGQPGGQRGQPGGQRGQPGPNGRGPEAPGGGPTRGGSGGGPIPPAPPNRGR